MSHSTQTQKTRTASKASKALAKWAELQATRLKPMIMIPHRLAKLVGCHPNTIYRALDAWVAQGDVVIHTPGNRSKRKAIELRLTGLWRKMLDVEKNIKKLSTTKPRPLSGLWDSTVNSQPKVSDKVHTNPQEALIQQHMEAFGCSKWGILKALKTLRIQERMGKALKDLRSVLGYLDKKPDWLDPKKLPGLIYAVVTDPGRARALRRQQAWTILRERRMMRQNMFPKPNTGTSRKQTNERC